MHPFNSGEFVYLLTCGRPSLVYGTHNDTLPNKERPYYHFDTEHQVDSAIARHVLDHTPSIAFRHLPSNSTRLGYATGGALFISAQLFTDAVALRKIWVLKRLWKQHSIHSSGAV